MTWLRSHARIYTQIGFSVLSNGNLHGFLAGKIYRGNLKTVCVPGLNCYSCPGAFGACPIGSLQAVENAKKFNVSFYAVGLLFVFGALLGRFVCGWLCPFGWIEDLVYKIPFFQKAKKLPGDRWLKYLRYGILALFVVALPIFISNDYGTGSPWFCKYICPSGTLLAGIPMVVRNAMLANQAGLLFWWKVGVLVAVLIVSMYVWRPFCRYLCPLGAIYGLFNPIAAVRLTVDGDACTSCGACQRACKMDIAAYQTPNSPDCVRCTDCVRACPQHAIHTTLYRQKKDAAQDTAAVDSTGASAADEKATAEYNAATPDGAAVNTNGAASTQDETKTHAVGTESTATGE